MEFGRCRPLVCELSGKVLCRQWQVSRTQYCGFYACEEHEGLCYRIESTLGACSCRPCPLTQLYVWRRRRKPYTYSYLCILSVCASFVTVAPTRFPNLPEQRGTIPASIACRESTAISLFAGARVVSADAQGQHGVLG